MWEDKRSQTLFPLGTIQTVLKNKQAFLGKKWREEAGACHVYKQHMQNECLKWSL